MSVFEDREGNIWVGTATTGVNRFQRKPLPFKRYRHEPDNPQSLCERPSPACTRTARRTSGWAAPWA